MPKAKGKSRFPSLPPGMSLVWCGLVLPPAMWCSQLMLVYVLASHSHLRAVKLGLGVATGACLLGAALALIPCLRERQVPGRVGFLARFGLCCVAVFSLTIVAEGVALFMLDSSIF